MELVDQVVFFKSYNNFWKYNRAANDVGSRNKPFLMGQNKARA